MFDRRQLVARGAAVVLMFASFGYAQADDANEYLAELRADLDMADEADVLTTFHTDIRATADVQDDRADVIEEIVVFGKKKRKLPNLGRRVGTDPVVQKPSRVDWQFLPRYDPEQAYPYSDQVQLNQEIQRSGFIQLFRVRFGR